MLSSNDLDTAESMMASDTLQDSPKVAHTGVSSERELGTLEGTRKPQKSRRAGEESTMLIGGSNCVYLLLSQSAGICTQVLVIAIEGHTPVFVLVSDSWSLALRTFNICLMPSDLALDVLLLGEAARWKLGSLYKRSAYTGHGSFSQAMPCIRKHQ